MAVVNVDSSTVAAYHVTQRQMAVNPQTKPNNLGCESAGRLLQCYYPHSPLPFYNYPAKADIHFTTPQRVEG